MDSNGKRTIEQPWSEEEIAFLKYAHGHETVTFIARFLDRSRGSISGKTARLGLRKRDTAQDFGYVAKKGN